MKIVEQIKCILEEQVVMELRQRHILKELECLNNEIMKLLEREQ